MSDFVSNNGNKIGAGLGITVLLIVIFSFMNAGVFNLSEARNEPSVIITGGSSNGTGETTQCINLSNGAYIIKNSTAGNCYVKSIVGSADISITNGTNTITIDYNGSSSETTQCINVGSGTIIIKNSTAGNCYVKTLVNGNGIIFSNGTNTITITNSLPENTSGVNIGSGKIVFKNETSDVLYFKTLVGSPDISITNSSATVTIDYNGSAITSVTSNSNNTIGVVTTGSGVTLYPKYVLLCQNSLGSSSNSLSCSSFAGKRHLYIEYEVYGVTSTVLLGMQFNSDTATNYSFRKSDNYGADTGAVTRNNVTLNGNSIPAGGTLTGYMHCNNESSHRKLCNGESTQDANAGSGTTVNYSAYSLKWANTSAQITTVTLVRGGLGLTGSFNTGSNISVWGYD